MNTFHIELLSPERAFYIGECVSLVIETSDGKVGIMANRAPMTASLPDGELYFTKPDGEKTVCAISRGMVSVDKNVVKVLCESILLPEEIDAETERRKLLDAQLRNKEAKSHMDYVVTKLAVADAMNKLRVKKHNGDIKFS